MEHLQVPEVELNGEAGSVEPVLPSSHEFLHGREWSNEDPALSLHVHVPFKLSGHISGISHNDAEDVSVDHTKDVTVIGSGTSESETEKVSGGIPRHGHFEAIKPAF